ncbi:unnamed protein product [Prorocentrum cordatum]|uniref:Uncharacterized protein n=1 Tax=Prorocentrum cordatum TaxID=2364126 RepID=A0ABN9SU71_9DINO|nr:unnamed protein product [Polarella glacialis]
MGGGFKLLGAPIGAKDYCEAFTQRRADKTKPALEALANLHPQVGLALLRYCASYAKLVYSARTAPSALLSEALHCFDDGQRRALSNLLAADLTDAQWRQAARGFAHAGLGLRELTAHAPGAYLASLAATRHLCCDLGPAYAWAPNSAATLEGQALLAYNALPAPADGLDPAALDRATQKQLSAAVDERGHQTFLAGLGAADRADINSEMLPGASDFLEAQPSEQLGLLFEPEEFACEVKRRLLMPVYETEHFCPCCEDVCDRHGRHAGLCAGAGIANVVGTFATSAGFNPTLEQPGLLPPRPDDVQVNGRRPADVYIPSWFQGAPAAFDFAVSSPRRQAARVLTFQEVGRAAQEYELVKRNHFDTERQCQQQGIDLWSGDRSKPEITDGGHKTGLLNPEGFLAGRSMPANVAHVEEVMATTARTQAEGCALFFNFAAAFHSLEHETMLRRIATYQGAIEEDGRLSGLKLNIHQTIFAPLFRFDRDELRERVARAAPLSGAILMSDKLLPLAPTVAAEEERDRVAVFHGPANWVTVGAIEDVTSLHFPRYFPDMLSAAATARARVARFDSSAHGGLKVRQRARALRKISLQPGNRARTVERGALIQDCAFFHVQAASEALSRAEAQKRAQVKIMVASARASQFWEAVLVELAPSLSSEETMLMLLLADKSENGDALYRTFADRCGFDSVMEDTAFYTCAAEDAAGGR